MVERIVKSIQDLKALSRLHSENALSDGELEKCKDHIIETLRTSRERLSTADLLEPLQLLREIYLDETINIDQYSLTRSLVLKHAILSESSNSLETYREIFAFYKQGLISIGDLHKAKKEIIGDGSDIDRTGSPLLINRLRDTYRPFVGGKYVSNTGGQIWVETSEGVWHWHLNLTGSDYRSDATINYYLSAYGGTVDWGTTGGGVTTITKVIELINNDDYIEEEVLIQLQGLTNTELESFLNDINSSTSDTSEILDVFKRLIPIITL